MDNAREEFLNELRSCNQLCKNFNTEQINNIMDRIKMDTKISREEIKEIITQILREYRIKNAILPYILENFPSNFLKDLID